MTLPDAVWELIAAALVISAAVAFILAFITLHRVTFDAVERYRSAKSLTPGARLCRRCLQLTTTPKRCPEEEV